MEPNDYFVKIVLPTYHEYRADVSDVRRAMLACMVTYHTVDALAVDADRKPMAVYKELERACPYLSVVKAVALAGKHIRPTQEGFEPYALESLKVGLQAPFGDGTYFDDGTSFTDDKLTVILAGANVEPRDVEMVLNRVVAFLSPIVAATTKWPSGGPI